MNASTDARKPGQSQPLTQNDSAGGNLELASHGFAELAKVQ